MPIPGPVRSSGDERTVIHLPCYLVLEPRELVSRPPAVDDIAAMAAISAMVTDEGQYAPTELPPVTSN